MWKFGSQNHQTVDNLVVTGLLVDAGKTGSRWIEDSDEEDVSYSQCYKVSPSTAILEVIGAWKSMIAPMLDAYYCTACNLQMLVGRQVPDVKFIQNTQSYINDLLQKGSLRYGESICVDPIRNAVKLFESQSIIESYTHDSVRLLYLSTHYDSEEQLSSLLLDIDSFRS
ncbi:hypothetical protein C7M84_000919 [Penaeus vannamei]|uniref:GPAT/DHAPAT C-terminal domain-containing protein n=1 Tax=Penaeus vannamei TaxID=6689 RepID=A0A423TV71_PENVA|nr:uncharacterized protein LOC113810218 [Penaeus vannamei]ROT80340.1 hypothetical protein C7M84_000919 [Penaeus vannamei]